MSNFSLPNLARQRKICWCEIKACNKVTFTNIYDKDERFARVNRNLPNTFYKVSQYRRGNVTSLYWFAGIYERCLHIQMCMFRYVRSYNHSCEHNSKENTKIL